MAFFLFVSSVLAIGSFLCMIAYSRWSHDRQPYDEHNASFELSFAVFAISAAVGSVLLTAQRQHVKPAVAADLVLSWLTANMPAILGWLAVYCACGAVYMCIAWRYVLLPKLYDKYVADLAATRKRLIQAHYSNKPEADPSHAEVVQYLLRTCNGYTTRQRGNVVPQLSCYARFLGFLVVFWPFNLVNFVLGNVLVKVVTVAIYDWPVAFGRWVYSCCREVLERMTDSVFR